MFDIADFIWQRQTGLLGEADVTFINQFADFFFAALENSSLKIKTLR
ncbi:hypothetical protein [uncultured Chryseobacterium sp.]|nr:hypothetical protein [uncultured Chryseobacterium sp.]